MAIGLEGKFRFVPLAVLLLLSVMSSVNAVITATPNPNKFTNLTLDVSQITIANTVLSGSAFQYTGNWLWTPPASSNLAAANTIMATIPTSNNAMTLTIAPSSSNSMQFTFNGVSYYANTIGTNTIYGSWSFKGFVNDLNGNTLSLSLNSIGVNAVPTVTITPSNIVLDSGQSETYTATVSGGTGSFALRFANGTAGVWTTTNSYPINIDGDRCSSYNGNVYCVGGYDGAAMANVFFAKVLGGGGLGSWIATNTYPLNITTSACFVGGSNLYCVGGSAGSSYVNSNGVYYAPIFGGGGVGSWTASNTYPVNLTDHTCASYNGFVYCVGGQTGACGGCGVVANVYYANILSAGGVGTWTTTNAYPVANYRNSCNAWAGYLYCVAGSEGLDVNYAKIFSGGGVGSWTATNSYPGVSFNYYISCSAYNAYLYCFGGYNGTFLNNVYYSPILSGGGVGTWTVANSFPLSSFSVTSCPASNGTFDCVGGYVSGVGPSTNVYYMGAAFKANTISSPGGSGTFSFVPVQGTRKFILSSTDIGATAPFVFNSVSNTIVTDPTLASIGFTASNSPAPPSTYQVLSATISGGTAPYTYNYQISNSVGLVANALYTGNSVTSNTFTFQTNSVWGSGTLTANLIVKDNATTHASVTNTLTFLLQNNMLTATITGNPSFAQYWQNVVIQFNGLQTINNQSVWSLYVNGKLFGTTNSLLNWSEQNQPGNYNLVFENPGNTNYTNYTTATTLSVAGVGSGGSVPPPTPPPTSSSTTIPTTTSTTPTTLPATSVVVSSITVSTTALTTLTTSTTTANTITSVVTTVHTTTIQQQSLTDTLVDSIISVLNWLLQPLGIRIPDAG